MADRAERLQSGGLVNPTVDRRHHLFVVDRRVKRQGPAATQAPGAAATAALDACASPSRNRAA
jgi:hypothetical protein